MINKILNFIVSCAGVLDVILYDKNGNELFKNITTAENQTIVYEEELKMLIQMIYKTEIQLNSTTIIYDKIKLLLFKLDDKLLFISLSPETDLGIVDLTFSNIFYKIKRYFFLKEKQGWKEVKIKLSKDVKKKEIKISKDFLKQWENETGVIGPKEIEIETVEIKGLKSKIKISKGKEETLYINFEEGKNIGLEDDDIVLAHLIKGKAKIEEFFQ